MNRRFQFAVVATSTCIVALLLFGTVKVRSAPPEEPYTQLGVYSDVLTKIKVEYVEEPDIKAVTIGAINGLLESLDPFASYLNAEQYKQYQREHDLNRPNVGLILARGPGYFTIVDVAPGSAADKAKLSTGDVVESINKVSTRDMPLAFAEILLQGDAGTSVELSVLTRRQSDPETLTLTRSAITWPPVESRLITDKGSPIGYVATSTLAQGRVATIRQRIQDLERQGAKQFILDLRNNATGPIEEGIALADLFMDSGLITYLEGQKQTKRESTATADTVTKLPLVVLTNRGTAGAAEVAAAALLDSSRAKVVGEPTFGNAAVRKAITMDDGGAVILATAKYYTPSGKPILMEGVSPTITQIGSDPVADLNDPAGVQQQLKDLILERGIGAIQPPLDGK